MAKRKRHDGAKLPLFDLPLQPGTPDAGAGDPPAPPPAATSGPSVLYDEERAGGREAQLDLIEPEEPAANEEAGSAGRAAEAGESVDRALLGDRLLAGLADLAVQLTASGSALAAARALGVAVPWSAWLPFAVLALVFSFLYWMIPLAFWGHTPGMAWVGHSARAEGGEPLTFSQSFRRWLGALLTLAFAGLPLLMAWRGRSFSDRLSDSVTVAE